MVVLYILLRGCKVKVCLNVMISHSPLVEPILDLFNFYRIVNIFTSCVILCSLIMFALL